jgi:hypothetical protein
MADELGITHHTIQTDGRSRIKFTGEFGNPTIHIDEDGNDMSSWDETAYDVQRLYEDLSELITEKREREKLTREQLSQIKKRNKDRDMIKGLKEDYLCRVNSCLVIRFKNKLSVTNIKNQVTAIEREFTMNEIDELLDLIYAL